MEKLVDSVSAVSPDYAAFLRLGVFFNDGTRVAERHAGFYNRDGGGQALARGLDHTDGGAIAKGGGADVVCFVEVAVEAVVVEGYV